MDQQVAQTLWLPPGVCLLNPIPTMQLQPTSQHVTTHHLTAQLLKQQVMAHPVPATSMLQNQNLLHGQILQAPSQNIIHIPGLTFENLLLPPGGKQTFDMQPSSAPLIELPCNPLHLHFDKPPPLQTSSGIIPPISDATFRRQIMTSKVAKKKRISPSAKRRSRLRLIAFLESKKKQQNGTEEQNSPDENILLHAEENDVTPDTEDSHFSSASSDDVTMSPTSQEGAI